MTKLENKTKISIVDLGAHYRSIKEEVDKAVLDVLSSGHYVLGPQVKAFEEELAQYVGCKHAIACANGTDAITLSLMALGIKPGDEVITVSHSFFATSEAIALVGAKPVFVDINESDFNIDLSGIEKLITNKTKAIIPVHLYGQPCEIDKLVELAKKHNLYVIEDCAQAIGAKYKGQTVGTFGDIGTLSFFPTKNLGAYGDGGAILTNSDEVADRFKQLRVHGSSKRYVHDFIGLNSRLDEIQAAILRVELKYLDEWNQKRLKAAEYYNQLFKDLGSVIVPLISSDRKHIFHQYTIRVKNRDLLCEKLKERNIESIIYYPIPIHKQKAFDYLNVSNSPLPVTNKICNEILSLPIYPEITTEIQEYVANSVIDILKSC